MNRGLLGTQCYGSALRGQIHIIFKTALRGTMVMIPFSHTGKLRHSEAVLLGFFPVVVVVFSHK